MAELLIPGSGGGGSPSWLQSGSGSPVGAVTPSQKGALYQDKTNGALYTAIGATSADWHNVGGAGDVAAEGVVSVASQGQVFLLTADGEAGLSDAKSVSMHGVEADGIFWVANGDGTGSAQIQVGVGLAFQFQDNGELVIPTAASAPGHAAQLGQVTDAVATETTRAVAAEAAHAALTTTAHGGIVASTDGRLTDTRTPTDGTVTDAKITAGGLSPAKVTGTAVITTDARLSDQRTPSDNSVTSAKIVDGAIVDADVNASAAIAESKLSLASDAAAGTASRRTLGTSSTSAAAGNDSRLSDSRAPNGTAGGVLAGTFPNPGLITGATAATRYVGGTTSGAPASGTFLLGDFVVDQTGNLFVCVTAGSPGTWSSPSKSRNQLADTASGVIAENYQAVGIQAAASINSQSAYGYLIGLKAGDSVTGILMRNATAAVGATVPTLARFGIADSTGKMLAVSADLKAVGNWGTGAIKFPFASPPYVVLADGGYYACFVVNGTWSTPAQPGRVNHGNANVHTAVAGKAPPSFVWTGQTDLPAVNSSLTMTSGSDTGWYMAFY